MKILALYLTSIIQCSPKYAQNMSLIIKFYILQFSSKFLQFRRGRRSYLRSRLFFTSPPPPKLALLDPENYYTGRQEKMFCSVVMGTIAHLGLSGSTGQR